MSKSSARPAWWTTAATSTHSEPSSTRCSRAWLRSETGSSRPSSIPIPSTSSLWPRPRRSRAQPPPLHCWALRGWTPSSKPWSCHSCLPSPTGDRTAHGSSEIDSMQSRRGHPVARLSSLTTRCLPRRTVPPESRRAGWNPMGPGGRSRRAQHHRLPCRSRGFLSWQKQQAPPQESPLRPTSPPPPSPLGERWCCAARSASLRHSSCWSDSWWLASSSG